MPSRTVPVRSHYRDTEHKRVHVDRHIRVIDSGAPLQFNLEEVLGPEYDESENEVCSECGRYRPVHQRNLSGKAVCRSCHCEQVEDHKLRQVELEKAEQDRLKRERAWEHRKSYR